MKVSVWCELYLLQVALVPLHWQHPFARQCALLHCFHRVLRRCAHLGVLRAFRVLFSPLSLSLSFPYSGSLSFFFSFFLFSFFYVLHDDLMDFACFRDCHAAHMFSLCDLAVCFAFMFSFFCFFVFFCSGTFF